MMITKTIVTHINPDLDAIGSVWLLKRFGGNEFHKSELKFVPAGERLKSEDHNTVHVDTGLGKFDHHQEERGRKDTSATKLVYKWLISEGRIGKQEELDRMVRLITDIDHFKEYHWPEPIDDRYLFCLEHILNGAKIGNYVKSDGDLVEFGMLCLDGVLVIFKTRVRAEEDISKGISFESRWGKVLAVESANSGVVKLALKMGFNLVVRRDPEIGMVRIKTAPIKGMDLTTIYKKLKSIDSEATWYFHPSKKMVLNGSIRNPDMVPSKLALDEVIKIIKAL